MMTRRGQTPLTLSEPRGPLAISDGKWDAAEHLKRGQDQEDVPEPRGCHQKRRAGRLTPSKQSSGETAVQEAPPFGCRSCLEVWGRQRKPVQTLGFLTFSHVQGPLLAQRCSQGGCFGFNILFFGQSLLSGSPPSFCEEGVKMRGSRGRQDKGIWQVWEFVCSTD